MAALWILLLFGLLLEHVLRTYNKTSTAVQEIFEEELTELDCICIDRTNMHSRKFVYLPFNRFLLRTHPE